MRPEPCQVELGETEQPALVVWAGREYPVRAVLRREAAPSPDRLSFRETYLLDCGASRLKVYCVEYGAAGFRHQRLWWLGAIDPDPRGRISMGLI